MADLEHKVSLNEAAINRLEVELSALKEKVSFFNVIYGKFDVTLGKIQEMIENRRYENNEEIKDVYARLEASEQRIINEMKAIREEMKRQHDEYQNKISEIDKWRWIVVGAAGVVGWILNKFFGLGTT
jgi:DNA repair exonuclease SbcCD ATPase subunit